MSIDDCVSVDALGKLCDRVAISQDSEIKYVDESFLNLTGYPRDEALNSSLMEVLASDHGDETLEKPLEEGEVPDSYETEVLSKQGSIPVRISFYEVEYGGEPAVLTSFEEMNRDTSEEYEIDEEDT